MTTAGARGTSLGGPPAGRSRRRAVPLRMVAVWGALFVNVLAFSASATVLPIPQPVGQLLAQGSLVLALLLAFYVNPGAVMRPSLFLVLLTMLGVLSLMVSVHSEFVLGSVYRAARFLGFVAVLWLLTPWWGRRDMILLRCHRRVLWVVLATVFAGVAIAPGLAFEFEGRLAGVLWPIPPTQVAHYAAVLFGTSAVLWMCRVVTNKNALISLGITGLVLLSTHTRTALTAAVVGIVVAAASLFLGHVRVRRVSALAAVVGVLVATVFASQITTWALRGQSSQEAVQLTGRTKVWSAVFSAPRSEMEQLFGSGPSDQSFNGLPIDSAWVAAYVDQGWFGVTVQASIFLVLLLMAAARPRGPHRAIALFLIFYCLVASFTETGLGTASPYVLDLAVAAALLTPEARPRGNLPAQLAT